MARQRGESGAPLKQARAVLAISMAAVAIASTASAAGPVATPGAARPKPSAVPIVALRRVVQQLQRTGATLGTTDSGLSRAFAGGVVGCDAAQAEGDPDAWKAVEAIGQLVVTGSRTADQLARIFGRHSAFLQRYLPPPRLPDNRLGYRIRGLSREAGEAAHIASLAWRSLAEDLQRSGQGLQQHECHVLPPTRENLLERVRFARQRTGDAVRDYQAALKLLSKLYGRRR